MPLMIIYRIAKVKYSIGHSMSVLTTSNWKEFFFQQQVKASQQTLDPLVATLRNLFLWVSSTGAATGTWDDARDGMRWTTDQRTKMWSERKRKCGSWDPEESDFRTFFSFFFLMIWKTCRTWVLRMKLRIWPLLTGRRSWKTRSG